MTLRTLIFIILNHLFFINGIAQHENTKFNTITAEQCLKYFPSNLCDVRFYPSTDAVYILPGHEKDTGRQEIFNQFCRQEIFVGYILPGLNIKIITDNEALKMDLSDVNIFAFGTVNGNNWISNFLKRAKDFPIQIKDSSFIADTVYTGLEQTLLATWYNPDNYQHSVVLYVPLDIKYDQYSGSLHNISQYGITIRNKIIVYGNYYLKGNEWTCFRKRDFGRVSKDSSVVIVPDRPVLPKEREYKKIDGSECIFRYPSPEELQSCQITEKEVPSEPIRIEDVNDNFNNFNDLEWLKPICKQYKIIALGENYHHTKYASYFFNRILFALNTFDYYPVLVSELPYSWGGYINYYLEIADDHEASLFCDSVFPRMKIPKMFAQIRKWNKTHPSKKIEVGCSDMEHYLKNTVFLTLNPYLKKIKPDAVLNYMKEDTLKSYISEAENILIEAKKRNIVGVYPFQTPDYMASVLENVKASAPLIFNSKGFSRKRYQIMIKNVTSNQFLGEKITNSKCVFYGGDKHFQILYRSKKPFAETEGTYLARKFEPTKGKMYVIHLKIMSCGIEDSVCRIKPELGIQAEKELVKLFKEGKVKLNEPFIDKQNMSDRFWEYFYKLSYKYPGYAFRFNGANAEYFRNLKYTGLELADIALQLAYAYDYNTTIVIPYSPFGYN